MVADGTGHVSPWDVLGVSDEATFDDIRRAFIKEAKKWHPDKRPQDEPEADREHAKSRFVAVHAAYEELHCRDKKLGDEKSIGDPDAVRRSKVTYEGIQAFRIEAEEHLALLRQTACSTPWTAEQQEVLRLAARRAYRAVESLRREEVAAKYTLGVEEACCSAAGLSAAEGQGPPNSVDAPEEYEALDGPRQTLDHLKQAFVEIAFDTWSFAIPKWGFG